MNDSAMQVLSEIGMLLGRDEYPFVFNAGVVRPGELRPEFLSPETEQRNDETKPSSHRAGRSATRSDSQIPNLQVGFLLVRRHSVPLSFFCRSL